MPYSIEQKAEGKWCVYNNDTGEKLGEHPSRTEAMKQMKALYANEGKPKEAPKSDDKKKDDEGDHEYR